MSNPYVGEIRMFAGNFAPQGWLLCQGQLVSVDDYDTLFALIGTTYGGDGQTNFALPNLQSRIPLHQASGYPLATTGGVEQVALQTLNLPAHTHPALASSVSGTQTSPSGNYWAAWASPGYSKQTPNVTMSATALVPSGGSQPHDNMPPYLAINFIISMFGIYPSP